MKALSPLMMGLMLAVLAAAVAWPVVRFGFVLHDDPLEILQNPLFYPLDRAALSQIWTAPDFSRIYIPASYTALGGLAQVARWLDGSGPLGTPSPMIFHAAGVLLHALNTVLVFHLLCRAAGGEASWPEFWGALIFAAHPVQVESYARAGNLTVTLGVFWALLALVLFLKSLRRTKGAAWWLAVSFGLFGLGLLTRPSLVAWPVASWLYAWAIVPLEPEQGRVGQKLAVHLLPWAAVSLVYTGMTLFWQPAAFEATVAGGRWWERPAIAADSLAWYMAQAVWPSQLSIDHGRTPQAVMANATVWLSLAGVLGAMAVMIGRARTLRLEMAGIAIFFVLLLPVSGLVPAANREAVSIVYDRHLYLPLAGLALTAAALLRRIKPDAQWWIGIGTAALLAFLSRQYQRNWRDSAALFSHALAVNPASWYVSAQLGTAWLHAGRPEEAVPLLARSLALNPRLADTRINLGQALLDCGRIEEGETLLREALRINPRQANGYNSLALALLRRQAWPEAETAAQTALGLDPSHPLAGVNLALAQAAQGKTDEALTHAQRATAQHPLLPNAWLVLAKILRDTGQEEKALQAQARAEALKPHKSLP
jgi:tetratricopeptide (TPR) repeat protein